MADGVAITPGLGTTIATDDVGGVQYQRVKVTFGDDGFAADASATNPLPVNGSGSVISTWATPTNAQDVRTYSDVEVQIAGTPGTAYVPTRSLDGTNYVPTNAYDKDGNSYPSIAAAGIYSLDGGGYLKFSAGAGSTVTIKVAP